jgi:hypothetical protein
LIPVVAREAGHLTVFQRSPAYTTPWHVRAFERLNAMIADHLGRWGPSVGDTIELLRSDIVAQVMSAVDYQSVEPSAPPDSRLIVGAWHDQMARRELALALHDRWGGELYWHSGSHVGHLFAAGVQRATERFLRTVTEQAGSRSRE